ncbi:MAG TPA: MFS transporter [Alphaproteobacteria bacterium]
MPGRSPTRAIAFLACASFASLAMVRVSDTLLPQIAADLGTTVGAASIVVTAYALTHGGVQLFVGPIGDRVGSYRTVAIACAAGAFTVLLCGLAPSLPMLALARLLSGACAAWIIPMSMAFIGDVTPYERRQQVLGRYLTGGISGLLFGQAAGGILGDHLGWRAVFFLLAGLFALAAAALVVEMTINPLTRPARHGEARRGGFAADYRIVFGNRWARLVILAVLLEALFAFGPLTYVGADLHLRFGLSFTMVGAIVAAFGAGGLVYVASVKPLVARLGQRGLVTGGGAMLAAAYLMLAAPSSWWLSPLAVGMIGLGYYMLHNTLQTNATQMTPEARGTAIAVFSSALYLGQMIGVALAAPIVDRYGAPVIFVAAAVALPALGLWFARELKLRAGALS